MRLATLVLAPLALMAAALASPTLAADARSMTGVWEGGYDCWHGKTFLRLTLVGEANGDLKGTWRFGQVSYEGVPQQPVPDGEFQVHGWLDDDGSVFLAADEWILKPEGDWAKFGLNGKLGQIGSDRAIGGFIRWATCGKVAVFKK